MTKKFTTFVFLINILFFSILNISNVNAQEELNVYNWGDYINPAVLEKFEAETGIKVNLDVYGSNEEMLAKIQAGASLVQLYIGFVYECPSLVKSINKKFLKF